MDNQKTDSDSQYSSNGTGPDLAMPQDGTNNRISPKLSRQRSSSGTSINEKPLAPPDDRMSRRRHIQLRLREIRELVSNCSELISHTSHTPRPINDQSKPSCSATKEILTQRIKSEQGEHGDPTPTVPPIHNASPKKLGTLEALGVVLQYIRRRDSKIPHLRCREGVDGEDMALFERGAWDLIDNHEAFAGYGMDEVEAVNYTLELEVSLPAGQVIGVSGSPAPFGFSLGDLHGRYLTDLVDPKDYCLLLHCCMQPDVAKRCVFARLKSANGLTTRCQLQFWSIHSRLHVWISSAEMMYKYPKVGKSFSSRHSSLCHIKHISPGTVYTTGYLPQDLVGKSLLLLAHSDDIEALKDAHYLVIQAKGKPVKGKQWRFKNADGVFLTLETEWSYFQNPWSKRVEFVIGRHKVVSEQSSAISNSKSLDSSFIKKVEEEICKLLTKHHAWPTYHSKHSMDSLGSSNCSKSRVPPNEAPIGETKQVLIGASKSCIPCDILEASTKSVLVPGKGGSACIVVTPISPAAPMQTSAPTASAPIKNSFTIISNPISATPIAGDNTAASYLDDLIEDCINNNTINNNSNNNSSNNNNHNSDQIRSDETIDYYNDNNDQFRPDHQHRHRSQPPRFIGTNLFSAAVKNCGGELSAWNMLQNFAAKLQQNTHAGRSAGSSPDSLHSGPSYSQIIRSENIERYFESNPKTHSSDESSSDKPKSASQSPEHEIERSDSTKSVPLTSEVLQRHEHAFRISWKRRRASMLDDTAHTTDASSVVTPSKINRRTSSFPRPASMPVMKEQHAATPPPAGNYSFVRPSYSRGLYMDTPSSNLPPNLCSQSSLAKWGSGPNPAGVSFDQSDPHILMDQRNSQSAISSSSRSSMDITSIRTPHYHITTAPLSKTRVLNPMKNPPIDANSPAPATRSPPHIPVTLAFFHASTKHKNPPGTTISFVATPTIRPNLLPSAQSGIDTSSKSGHVIKNDSAAGIGPQPGGIALGTNQRDLISQSTLHPSRDNYSSSQFIKKPIPQVPRLLNHGCPLPPDILFRYTIPTPADPQAVLAKDREFLERSGPLSQNAIPNQQLEKLYANGPQLQLMSFSEGFEKSPVREVAQAMLLLEES